MTRAEAMSLSTVHYVPLPETIFGMVKALKVGYIIAINSTMSKEEQEQTLEHELAHIRLNHFDSEAGIRTVEVEAEALVASERQ